jgi:hypothetical protein
MNAAGKLACEQLIDHTMAFEPGLSLEGFRHNIDAVVSLPARPVPGMAFVLVGFVQHLEALRRESLGQLLCDEIGGPHAARLGEGSQLVNGWHCSAHHDQVLNASLTKAHNVRS